MNFTRVVFRDFFLASRVLFSCFFSVVVTRLKGDKLFPDPEWESQSH